MTKACKIKMSTLETDRLRKRLLYQSQRRGILEIDLLLGKFVKETLPTLSFRDLQAFEECLALSDQELYEWLSQQSDSLLVP